MLKRILPAAHVTVTLLDNTKLPLTIWFLAIYLTRQARGA